MTKKRTTIIYNLNIYHAYEKSNSFQHCCPVDDGCRGSVYVMQQR